MKLITVAPLSAVDDCAVVVVVLFLFDESLSLPHVPVDCHFKDNSSEYGKNSGMAF